MVMKRRSCMNSMVSIYTTNNGATARERVQRSPFETRFYKKNSVSKLMAFTDKNLHHLSVSFFFYKEITQVILKYQLW